MSRLIVFELGKIIKKKSFLMMVIGILLLQIFLLWYGNQPDYDTPPLSAYKAFEDDIRKMSETEKQTYVEKLYEEIQGIRVVEEVLFFMASGDEMGNTLAQQTLSKNPGVLETYREKYESGEYLRYTESLQQEFTLITELYEEMKQVSGYQEYLESISENQEKLSGISIFASKEEDTFSSRNIKKSAGDHEGLKGTKITFYPSKGILSAMGNHSLDVFLLLLLILFANSLIYEEKEKNLFLVTRATVYGRGHSIVAKLLALAIYCIGITIIFYGGNLLFFEMTTGIGDLSRSIQSVESYMECNLPISVFTYIVFCIITKSVILFAIGAFVVFLALVAKHGFLPYLGGGGLLLVSFLLYRLIPVHSGWNWMKYLNYIGLFWTENIYGGYMNFKLFGFPVSRLTVSLIAILFYVIFGITISVVCFLKCRNLEYVKPKLSLSVKFRPHNSLVRHEGYKLLILNRAGLVLMLFAGLIGYWYFSQEQTISIKESYYQSMMLQLEGELTPEKEALLESEKTRYEEAFAQIARIEELINEGRIDAATGDSMKMQYSGEIMLYPTFQRILNRYDRIMEDGGEFLYDTGYLRLLGIAGDGYSEEFLLLTVCVIFAFSNASAMENRKNLWQLLSATTCGKRRIICVKLGICSICTFGMVLVAWICRIIQIYQLYPMHRVFTSVNNIQYYWNLGVAMPLIFWILMMFLIYVVLLELIMLVVFGLSYLLKSHVWTMFVSILIFVVPFVLYGMGVI